MTPKFTPGPWKLSVTPEGQEFGAIISTAKNQNRICLEVEERCYGGIVVCESVSDRADARLIAKSPAMYKELRRLQEVVGEEDAKIIEQLLSEIDGED